MKTETDFHKPKVLDVVLWVAQIALALMFLAAGFAKIARPLNELAATMSFVAHVPPALVRFIGISEFLGGIGLILPALLRIKPRLTPWAATGLAAIMVLAFIFHLYLKEFQAIGANVIIGAIAAFIMWGRFKMIPIEPRS